MDVNLTGYRPDPTDMDFRQFETELLPGLPRGAGSVDLRPYASRRHHQTTTSTCVAQAVIKALENLERQHLCNIRGIPPGELETQAHTDLSVLALYYLCREQMTPPQIDIDRGTYIWLACHCLETFGVCSETTWPYNPANINISPDLAALREAREHKENKKHPLRAYKIQATGAERVHNVQMALWNRLPVVYATMVGEVVDGTPTTSMAWDQYMATRPPLALLSPPRGQASMHATHLLGWDEQQELFIGENSWGDTWGDNGFYWIEPTVIASDMSQDVWVITGNWEDEPR